MLLCVNWLTLRQRSREYIDTSLERWIGFAYPPVHRAIAEVEWQPNNLHEWCHRCGDSVGEGEANESGCTTCRDGAELSGGIGHGVLRLGSYEGVLQEWIHAIKFGCWSEMAEFLGRQMGAIALESKHIDPHNMMIVPMPMPWLRRMYRGIDHSMIIASGAARVMKSPIIQVLKREHVPPQVSLTQSERKKRGSRGLRVRRRLGGWNLEGADILLIDDVRTTGATLRAAVRLLKTLKPAKIVCAVIAVSDSAARRKRAEMRELKLQASTIPAPDVVGT